MVRFWIHWDGTVCNHGWTKEQHGMSESANTGSRDNNVVSSRGQQLIAVYKNPTRLRQLSNYIISAIAALSEGPGQTTYMWTYVKRGSIRVCLQFHYLVSCAWLLSICSATTEHAAWPTKFCQGWRRKKLAKRTAWFANACPNLGPITWLQDLPPQSTTIHRKESPSRTKCCLLRRKIAWWRRTKNSWSRLGFNRLVNEKESVIKTEILKLLYMWEGPQMCDVNKPEVWLLLTLSP